jgi:hypothetical protein
MRVAANIDRGRLQGAGKMRWLLSLKHRFGMHAYLPEVPIGSPERVGNGRNEMTAGVCMYGWLDL